MMNTQDLSSTNARLLVLEMSIAAVIAQLPKQALDEVAGMLCFVANASEEAGEIAPHVGEQQLSCVRHWASEMLQRVMVSRKATRSDAVSPVFSPQV